MCVCVSVCNINSTCCGVFFSSPLGRVDCECHGRETEYVCVCVCNYNASRCVSNQNSPAVNAVCERQSICVCMCVCVQPQLVLLWHFSQ